MHDYDRRERWREKKMKDGETMCIRIKYLEGMEVKINYRVLGDRQRKKRLKL